MDTFVGVNIKSLKQPHINQWLIGGLGPRCPFRDGVPKNSNHRDPSQQLTIG